MNRFEQLQTDISQIYSLVIKDLKLKLRYKDQFFIEYIVPLLSLFFPYIVFTTIFNLEGTVFESYFSINNYVLFLLLAYCVECLIFLLWNYREAFQNEKIWKTLTGMTVAPLNKYNIFIAYLISGLIAKSLPIIIIVILCSIMFPIPLTYFLLVLLVLLCIALTFSGMGYIIGVFQIINESISASLTAGISFISLVSCLFYPIDIFPESVHFIILLNPLYYYFDLLRLVWWAGIYEPAINLITLNHILFVTFFTIFTPIVASFLFAKLYYKYGISGY